MRRLLLSTLICIFVSIHAFAGDGSELQVKVEKAAPPGELQGSIKELLGDEALRVEGKDGPVCTLWLRKEIPSKATAQQIKNGLTYREIPPTTIIGVIELPAKWIDFRKQEIAKGVYTLRLAIQPMDGDHMGTAPHNEFCLLTPAAKDDKPGLLDVKSLTELSSNATGSTHPSVLLLFPNAKPEDTPKIIDKGNKIWVLNVKRTVVANGEKAALGFGFTVNGHTME